MKYISDYMREEKTRHMLNDLTRKTFGFDFEDWVTKGYFEGDYIPHSIEHEGKIISNVSANRMQFMQNGVLKNYIQIGTVMTDETFRKQGLAADLIKRVIEEYKDVCDGIYLFGNLDALGFYQKMGFAMSNQYRYFVKEEFCKSEKAASRFKPVADLGDEKKKQYLDLVRESVPHSSFEQINKFGLQMFYTSGFDNVFYEEDIDCFIVLEPGDRPVLQSILSKKKVALTEVLRRLDINCCSLGFTPLDEDKEKCISEVYDGGDDYRLFYMGEALRSIEQEKLYFPDLSHA